jgi:hypothetical protein
MKNTWPSAGDTSLADREPVYGSGAVPGLSQRKTPTSEFRGRFHELIAPWLPNAAVIRPPPFGEAPGVAGSLLVWPVAVMFNSKCDEPTHRLRSSVESGSL